MTVTGRGDGGRVALLALAVAAVLGAAGSWADQARAASSAHAAYMLDQRQGDNVSRLTLAPTGLRFDVFAPVRSGGKLHGKQPTPLVGLIIAYRGARLTLLDPTNKRYQVLALSTAISSYRQELSAAARGQPSIGFPAFKSLSNKPTPSTPPRARLRRLALTGRIGPFATRAYLLGQGPLRERLWYASGLPGPPAQIRGLIAGALNGSASGSLARALRAHAAEIPLRIDVPSGRRWRVSLRTVRVRRVVLRGSTLKPPHGYTQATLAPSPVGGARPGGGASAHAADVPAQPLRCGVSVLIDPIGCLTGFGLFTGPVSDHPSVWALYWGTAFSAHPEFVNRMNNALENMTGDDFAYPAAHDFWGGLDGYGVHKGRFLGYTIVNERPDAGVGDSSWYDVMWFVFTQRWKTDGPKYWWRYGLSDQDPMYAVFVDESEVNPSGWGGYHFFTPTEGFLFDFLVHPNMPWFIVKVPPDALGIAPETTSASFDEATRRTSHEFVETATDPYPFISWADPLKEPIWEQGEIADICAQGSSYPWGKATRIGGIALSAYWSNNAHACIPDTQPDGQILSPRDGSTVGWDTPVDFIIQTNDLYDGGPLPDSAIRWYTDLQGPLLDSTGGIAGRSSFTTRALKPGIHHVFADIRDSQGGFRTVGPVTINVVAQPPAVTITHPADGATYGSDETIAFRGSAIDPGQGDIGPSATWSVDGTKVGTGAALFQYDIATQGKHTVTLSATNGAGLSSSASITVNIGAPTGKPSVAITSPPTGSHYSGNEQITFSAVGSTPSPGTISNSSYSWSDDVAGPLGTGQTIMHQYYPVQQCSGAVTHTVTVTLTDSLNRTATDTITLTVGSIC